MADNKKGFVLYADLIHTINKMPSEKAGDLFKHILSYVNDENPQTDDILIDLVFEPIKQQLKRDLKKYEDKKVQWSEAGKRSAELRKAKKIERALTDVGERSTDSTVIVKDTVNVTVKDKVIVKDIIKKENRFNFRKSLVDYGFDETLVNDWLTVRKKKKASNTKTAFNGFIKQVELCKMPINEILTECVNRSWGGLKAEWLLKSSVNKTKQTGADEWRELGKQIGI